MIHLFYMKGSSDNVGHLQGIAHKPRDHAKTSSLDRRNSHPQGIVSLQMKTTGKMPTIPSFCFRQSAPLVARLSLAHNGAHSCEDFG